MHNHSVLKLSLTKGVPSPPSGEGEGLKSRDKYPPRGGGMSARLTRGRIRADAQ